MKQVKKKVERCDGRNVHSEVVFVVDLGGK
jgi:hypothetical protein